MNDQLAGIQALLAGPMGLVIAGALLVLALLFLVLWLLARRGGGGGGGDSAVRQELKAAQNQVRLLKGDAVQASRDNAANLAKLNKELENYRAMAGGKPPPELEEWRQRALAAEGKLQTEIAALTDRHKKQVEVLERALGVTSATGTVVTSRTQGAVERLDQMEKELAQARAEIEAADARHRREMADLTERLAAERTAALTAASQRHAAEIEALRGGGRKPVVDVGLLTASGDLPANLRFPYLEVLGEGEDAGKKHFVQYGTTTIGRDPSSALPIDDRQVSSHHAAIVFDGTDFRLVDNGSLNGTFANGRRLAAGEAAAAALDFDDEIGFADVKLLRFGCAARDLADSDPAVAARAFEAMVAIAPQFRIAIRDLATLLSHDPARGGDARALEQRLSALPPLPAAAPAAPAA